MVFYITISGTLLRLDSKMALGFFFFLNYFIKRNSFFRYFVFIHYQSFLYLPFSLVVFLYFYFILPSIPLNYSVFYFVPGTLILLLLNVKNFSIFYYLHLPFVPYWDFYPWVSFLIMLTHLVYCYIMFFLKYFILKLQL